MDIKLLEVRDSGTFIPVMAVRCLFRDEAELFLLRRAGYGLEQIVPGNAHEPYVLVTSLLGDSRCQYDPFSWGNRTMHTAHLHIVQSWNELRSGSVIDVEFIRGETMHPKTSERLTHGY